MSSNEQQMVDDSKDSKYDEAVLPVATSPPPPEPTKLDIRAFLDEEVNTDIASVPLSLYSFMTGYIDAVSFTACYIWCAFQTGNTIQLALALARLFSGDEKGTGFHMPDRQALVSLVAFLGGAFLGRIGDRIGPKKRLWLVIGTLLQAGLTLAAALTAQFSHTSGFGEGRTNPSWTNTLGFLALAFASASMGLQAHTGTRLGSQFATTVVLTTIWVQFVSEPKLFEVQKVHRPREFKALAVFSLFLGGLVGRALVDTIGTATTLGLGAGLRLLIALSWLMIPAK